MSIFWGAVVAIVIAAEKLLERGRLATHATAGLLAVLGVLVLAAPQAVPALTIPVG
jgi:predicted metal-binding membrane protein